MSWYCIALHGFVWYCIHFRPVSCKTPIYFMQIYLWYLWHFATLRRGRSLNKQASGQRVHFALICRPSICFSCLHWKAHIYKINLYMCKRFKDAQHKFCFTYLHKHEWSTHFYCFRYALYEYITIFLVHLVCITPMLSMLWYKLLWTH